MFKLSIFIVCFLYHVLLTLSSGGQKEEFELLTSLDEQPNLEICTGLIDIFVWGYSSDPINSQSKERFLELFELQKVDRAFWKWYKPEFYILQDSENIDIKKSVWKPCQFLIQSKYELTNRKEISPIYNTFNIKIKLNFQRGRYQLYVKGKNDLEEKYEYYYYYERNDMFKQRNTVFVPYTIIDIFGLYIDSTTMDTKFKTEQMFGVSAASENRWKVKWINKNDLNNIYQYIMHQCQMRINLASIVYEKQTAMFTIGRKPKKELWVKHFEHMGFYGLYMEYIDIPQDKKEFQIHTFYPPKELRRPHLLTIDESTPEALQSESEYVFV